MGKDDYIRFRCSTTLKNLAESKANDYGMNLTDYMEYLIRKDADSMRIVFSKDLTEECLRELENEKSCYLSTDEKYWLFSDMNFFNYISHKYVFDKKNDEASAKSFTLDDYCIYKYDGEAFEWFGNYISLLDRSYAALEMFEEGVSQNNVDLSKWDKVIDCDVKTAIMIGVASEMSDDFKEMAREGYDIGLISSEVKMALESVELERNYDVTNIVQYRCCRCGKLIANEYYKDGVKRDFLEDGCTFDEKEQEYICADCNK